MKKYLSWGSVCFLLLVSCFVSLLNRKAFSQTCVSDNPKAMVRERAYEKSLAGVLAPYLQQSITDIRILAISDAIAWGDLLEFVVGQEFVKDPEGSFYATFPYTRFPYTRDRMEITVCKVTKQEELKPLRVSDSDKVSAIDALKADSPAGSDYVYNQLGAQLGAASLVHHCFLNGPDGQSGFNGTGAEPDAQQCVQLFLGQATIQAFITCVEQNGNSCSRIKFGKRPNGKIRLQGCSQGMQGIPTGYHLDCVCPVKTSKQDCQNVSPSDKLYQCCQVSNNDPLEEQCCQRNAADRWDAEPGYTADQLQQSAQKALSYLQRLLLK